MFCRRAIPFVSLMLALTACNRAPEIAPAVQGRDIVLARDAEVIEARVPANATLAGLLRGHQIEGELADRIVDAARRAFDPRRLRAAQPYRLERGVDGLVRLFEYRIDGDRFLRIVGAGQKDQVPTFDVTVVPYEKQRAVIALRGEIDRDHSSLVAAVAEQHENVLLAMAIADVFGGEIDFNNDLQAGDSFEVVFEKNLSEGEFAGYGPVLAAEFRNDGRVLRAFRFQGPSGEAGYYDEQGRSMKRFFLRSPLKFEPRISSGFSYRRLHPVLGQWRAHPAIDYVAPVGAPVVAIAGGLVTFAGRAGGAGNMVTVRHNNGYESSYLHLSAIDRGARVGAHVSQGAMIGRVGATGIATGPHLDYRLKKNGSWVNPLVEHKRLPPGEPVPATMRAEFEAARDQAIARFIGSPTTPTVVADAVPARSSRPSDLGSH